jgi:hypothetical protein
LHRRARASTRSTSRSPEKSSFRRRLPRAVGGDAARLPAVVLLFEILLIAAVVVITWFALYTLYRLITDES